jgi:hypothetical protein
MDKLVTKLLLEGQSVMSVVRATGASRWTVTIAAARLGIVLRRGRPRKVLRAAAIVTLLFCSTAFGQVTLRVTDYHTPKKTKPQAQDL